MYKCMYKYLQLGLGTLGMLALMRVAAAAPDIANEQRPLDANIVRLRIDGMIDVRVRQGSPAMLALSGERASMASVKTRQSGDTLSLATERQGFRLGRPIAVQAELVLPVLHAVRSESLGNTEIGGFRGERLELELDGAGSMSVNGDFRVVTATLNGVGNMRLNGMRSETITLDLQGAGFVTLAGRGTWLRAQLGGLGGLDAQAFAADNVALDLSGLGNATVMVRQSIDLNLSGMGSVTVHGRPPNRRASVDGLGKVNWK